MALLTIDYPPSVGGVQAYLAGVVSLLEDWPVRVFVPGRSSSADLTGVQRLGSSGSSPVHRALLNARMARAATKWEPDVVIAGHVLTLPAALAARTRGRAGVMAIVYGSELRSPRSRWITRRLLHRADRVVAISRFTASEAAKIGARKDRISVVPPAIEPPPTDSRPLETSVQLVAQPYLLAIGRLDDLHKGQDIAVEAMAALGRAHPELILAIAGDGPARADLEERAAQLGVSDRVRFLGRVTDAEKATLMAGAQALLLLSRIDDRGRFEGFGIVVLEAGAYGVPAIVGAVGGLPDAVDHEETGLIVDSTDVMAVVAAVERVLDDDEARRLGDGARRRTLERFVWPARRSDIRALIADARPAE